MTPKRLIQIKLKLRIFPSEAAKEASLAGESDAVTGYIEGTINVEVPSYIAAVENFDKFCEAAGIRHAYLYATDRFGV